MSKVRSHVAVALAAALVAAFVVTGIQVALAGAGGGEARAIVDHGHESVTKTKLCPIGGGDCAFDRINARCPDGVAIGGVGWVVSPTDKIINLSAIDLVDYPVGGYTWRVASPEGTLDEGYRVKVRVYCMIDDPGFGLP